MQWILGFYEEGYPVGSGSLKVTSAEDSGIAENNRLGPWPWSRTLKSKITGLKQDLTGKKQVCVKEGKVW